MTYDEAIQRMKANPGLVMTPNGIDKYVWTTDGFWWIGARTRGAPIESPRRTDADWHEVKNA